MTVVARAAPLALTIVGFVAIGALWVWRALSFGVFPRGVVLAAGLIYGGWLAWESRVSRREVKRDATTHDGHTMELAAFAKIALLLATLVAPSAPSLTSAAIGLPLMVAGALLRIAAVRALGDRYSHRIREPLAPLVTTGPYAFVRHPAYLGTFIAHAGLVVAIPSAVAAAALVCLWLPAVVMRARVEDRFLLGYEPYATYARSVRYRLVPGIY